MDDDLSVDSPGVDSLSPEDELALSDLRVKQAARDECKTCFDRETAPKPPHPKEEGVTDRGGSRQVDLQAETPRVDDLASFDLSSEDLFDVDL